MNAKTDSRTRCRWVGMSGGRVLCCWLGVLICFGWAGLGYGQEAGAVRSRCPRWFAYRSFRPKGEVIQQFGQLGVDTVCFFPANTLCSLGVPYCVSPPVWTGLGRYNFASLDGQVAEIRGAHPRAKLLCMIDLNTPDWWARVSRCDDTFYDLGKTAASEHWRKETRAYLQAFLRHMEKRHGPAVAGYILACGSTTEWQDQSRGEESASRRAAWRRWMKERGQADPVDIPPASVREHTTHGVFRDPIQDRLAIEYWRFCHWLIGDAILYFAGATQEVIDHRVPVGIFYGYVFEHHVGRLLYEGHLDFDRVYRSDLLDFFIAPGSYFDRQIGGGSGLMVPLASVRHHGKGFIHEIDHRTHTAQSQVAPGTVLPGHRNGFANEQETIAGLRREFSLALIEGTSLWWFDMFGRWFEGQRVLDAIGQMDRLWDRLADGKQGPAAEVAVLVDAESMFYVDGQAGLLHDLLYRQRAGLSRMGAPYETISFADMPAVDMARYKLVVLPNLFVVDDAKKKVLDEKICTGGKTVVWVYQPGIITNGKYDPHHVEKLTGISPDVKDVTSRSMAGWTSVLSPKPNLPAGTLRRLAKQAGVHLYCDAEEPLYASAHLLAVHSLKGGERTFRLPRKCRRVRELFSDRVVAERAAEFTDRLAGPCTALYELETGQ